MPALPEVARKGRSTSIWLFAVLAVLVLGLIAYFAAALGAVASIIGLIVALVPFTAVLFFVRLIDRWEPEPKGWVVFAVLWGAVAAVAIALLVDIAATILFGPSRGDLREFFDTVVRAPIVEEIGKGLGVFIVFAAARRAFDGPVDGVVYGALVGAGFAFTENIQYFATSFIEGGASQLTMTFILRGLLSPFAHAMFTGATGFALGWAASRGLSRGAALGPGFVGLLVAIGLHGLWNGSAAVGNFFVLYAVLQVPLFVGAVVTIVQLRRAEARLTHARLGEFAAAGWFTPQEVDMLATPRGRAQGLAWAATLAGDRRPIMRSFIRDATELAATRQRVLSGRDPRAIDDERVLLVRTAAERQALLSY